MKRDMELVRKILFAIEDSPSGRAPRKLDIEGYTDAQISYHIPIMIEAGLIEGWVSKEIGNANSGARATRLTWSGHEFIEAARDETRWKKAMGMAKEKAGSVTLSVLTQLLNALMAKAVGLS